MKKTGLFMLMGMLLLTGCQKENDRVNYNRYGSMADVNGVLYYYANGCVYEYQNGSSTMLQEADTCFFEVREQNGSPVFKFSEKGQAYFKNPFETYDILNGAVTVVNDSQYVYARWPQNESWITKYKIEYDDNGQARNLMEVEKITY